MLGSSLVLFIGAEPRPPLRGFGGARFLAVGDARDALVDRSAQLLAAGAAGGFDVAEAEPEIGVGFVDGGADEGLSVVDADLGDVAGVVPDCDGLADEWGQGGAR
jgi:hypothetical protein